MPARDYYLPQRRLVNQADAALVATPHVPRSKFIGSWTRKTAFDAGLLIPILVDEILPGDHMTYDVSAYVRMATPLFPIFDAQRIDTHFFFVPNRIVWVNWEKFMGAQEDPGDALPATIPSFEFDDTQATIGSIFDHFGLPTVGQLAVPPQHAAANALPFRGYNLIFNEWFKDQNLQNNAEEWLGDGPDDPDDYTILRRNKFHDYFTSALPWPQKFTAPSIALGGLAPIRGIGFLGQGTGLNVNVDETARGAATNYPNAQFFDTENQNTTPNGLLWYMDGAPVTGFPQIFADLSQATGTTINDFREAMLVQELLERDARGGTRYIESIKNHFGVQSLDARLQRPEYIGGGSTPLNITPIAQTAPTASAPLGALGAAGSAAGQHRATYAATEHGYIIGLMSIRTELSYQQGMPRTFYAGRTRYDFYWPTLAGLGEQAIRQDEIFSTGVEADDAIIFGYQERWQEYRTRQNEVTGLMRSYATGGLGEWHLAQEFSPAPTLNEAFIQDNPPMDRILAAGALAAGQQYLADIQFRRTAIRPIPTFGIPASLTRF